MKTVGVRGLKARLTEYLCYVKRGGVVLVTESGEVVAELRRAQVDKSALLEWPELDLPPGTARQWMDDIRRDSADESARRPGDQPKVSRPSNS